MQLSIRARKLPLHGKPGGGSFRALVTDTGNSTARGAELMDEHVQPGDGQPQGSDPPRPFNPLPLEVSDELAAYATVSRQLPRDPAAPPKASLEAMGKLDTPFRPVEDIQRNFGAGTYRLDFFNDRHQFQGRSWLTVGARAETPKSPISTVSNAVPADAGDAPQRTALDAPPWAHVLLSRIDALERREAPASRGMTMDDMRTVLELARSLNPPQDAEQMARAFRQGMSIAREVFDRAAPANDNSIGAIIRDALPGVLQLIQAQGGAPAPAAPALVTTPAPAKGANVTPSWVMPMVSELNRAIGAQDDPAYTADWCERNLPAEVLTHLRGDEDQVMVSLKGYEKAVPGLLTPEGQQFARGVLRELRGEGEGDGESAAAAGSTGEQ